MELRHLRYFVAVAEALSFTKGAQKLHIAQPSLTRQIRDLEEDLGVHLFDRTKQRISLTHEGASFLVDAKRVLDLSEEIVESVRGASRHESPALNIGYVANLFYDLLPVTLAAFQRSFPNVPINLFDVSCGDQFAPWKRANSIWDSSGYASPSRSSGFSSDQSLPTKHS
jgi:DNA-binding transcriptional LysR family regulator